MKEEKRGLLSEWKSILLSLPDEAFFEILENYLGKVHTPYNKQVLVDRLAHFLSIPENRQRIFSLIDEKDARLLTAIEFMDTPDITLLYRFFRREKMGLLSLQSHLVNLEDRLLIFSYREDHTRRYQLFPLFRASLKESVLSLSCLIPIVPTTPAPSTGIVLVEDNYFMALLSLINQERKILPKKALSLLKRAISKGILTPPLLQGSPEAIAKIIWRILVNSGLMVEEEEHFFSPSLAAWKWLETLSPQTRTLHLLASAAASRRKDVRALICPVKRLFCGLPRKKGFTREALRQTLSLLIPTFHFDSFGGKDRFIDKMTLVNLLFLDKKNLLSLNGNYPPSPLAGTALIDSSFTITVPSQATFSALLPSIACIEKYDTLSFYKLSKHSFLSGRIRGWSSQEIIERLCRFSDKHLPANLLSSLEDWEREHKKWRLYSGIVLTVGQERRSLVEKTGILAPYIKEILAPGVFLLAKEEQEEWSSALKRLDVFLPPISKPYKREQVPFSMEEPFGDLPVSPEDWKAKVLPNQSSNVAQELFQCEAMRNLPKQNREGLRNRISRKLIFLPQQIARGIALNEINEAKGLDYRGKINLIEQALTKGSDRLELFLLGERDKRTIVPISLSGKGDLAELKGTLIPDEKEIIVLVSKISLLKRVRTSFL